MKAKYQIYKITLHSGEIYIGQHKGNVLIDGYIASPRGKNDCNFYNIEDVARIEMLDFANTKKEIDDLEIKYIDYYRKTFGVSSRITKEYEWLLKYFKPGVCLNISGGYSSVNCKKEQEYKDYFNDKLIDGGHPKMDFLIYLPNGDFIYLEYQGKQHYEEDPNDPEFGKYQREITDPLKKWYCKNKRIPLYEIRYDEDTIERLIEILIKIRLLDKKVA